MVHDYVPTIYNRLYSVPYCTYRWPVNRNKWRRAIWHASSIMHQCAAVCRMNFSKRTKRSEYTGESQSCLFLFLVVVANRHSWDADWSQFDNLEDLIGSRALYSDYVLLLRPFLSVKKHEIMVLACQVGPSHLTLTQINSESNCIAKNKCSESQDLYLCVILSSGCVYIVARTVAGWQLCK